MFTLGSAARWANRLIESEGWFWDKLPSSPGGPATITGAGSASATSTATATANVSTSASAPYTTQVLTDAPYLYWRLDEPSGGTAEDSTSNNRDGTYNNTPTLGVSGVLANNNAAQFSAASSEYVRSQSAIFNSAAATVEAWVKIPSAPSSAQNIAGCVNGVAVGTADKLLRLDTDGKLTFYVYDQASGLPKTTSTPANAIPFGEWVHVVGTIGATQARAYVNGVEVGNVGATSSYTGYGFANVQVAGADATAPVAHGYLDGSVDEFAIYETELSAARVLAHYQAAVPFKAGAGAATSVSTATASAVKVLPGAGAATSASTATATAVKVLVGAGAATSASTAILSNVFLIPDRAVGKVATASSQQHVDLRAEMAADGNEATRWSSLNNDGEWWKVDLGVPYLVDRVDINWEDAYASSYEIYTSLDDSTYTLAASETTSGAGRKSTTFTPVFARYVRVLCVTRGTVFGNSFWTASVYTTTRPDLAQFKTATASSIQGIYVPEWAVDYNYEPSSRWSSNFIDNVWWKVDLGSVQSINEVQILWEGAYGATYNISTSTDDSSYTVATSVTNNSAGLKQHVFPRVNARYVLFEGLTRGTAFGFSFYNFEVFPSAPILGAGSASSTSSATATAVAAITASAAAASTSTATASALKAIPAAGAATSASTATATAVKVLVAAATADSTSTATASAIKVLVGAGLSASTSTATASAALALVGAGTASSSSTATASAIKALIGAGTASSTSSATASAFLALVGAGAATSTSTATASAVKNLIGAGTASSSSSATASAVLNLIGAGVANSTSSATADAIKVLLGSATANSVSSATASAAATILGAAAAASSSSATADAIKVLVAAAISAAVSSATATGDISSGDVTAPIPNITTSPSKSKISRISGQDVTTFTIQSDEAYIEYKLKVVPSGVSPHTAGTLIETDTGSFPASTDHNLDVTDDELVDAGLSEGDHVVKVFLKDAAGNWST